VSEKKTILVGLSNPRTAAHLVQIGVELAKTEDARLLVVSIVIVPPGESLSTAAREARAQRRLLRKASSVAAGSGIPADTLVRAGHTVDEALVDVAAEVDANLLIVGWAPLSRFGPPSQSAMWRLSQEPPCDVLSVKPFDLATWPRRILVPVRGGQHAEMAARVAVGLARLWGAEVTILRVIPAYVGEEEARIESESFREYWEGMYANAARAVSAVAPNVFDYLVGESGNHDLIIMGAAASSRSYSHPFGQFAEALTERVTCPIIIAKTEQALSVDDLSGSFTAYSSAHAASAGDVSSIVDKWFAENTFHSKEFASISDLVRLKEQQGVTISLVLPTLNEEETIGDIIRCMKDALLERHALLDEILVIDSRSQDRTATIARLLGVPVHVHQDILPANGTFSGKGEALWKSLAVAKGDIIVWIDTDIANIHPKFVYGLLGPLLREPRLAYVKGFYRRPLRQGGVLHESSGGRVTELTARPLINLFYPLLSGLIQPLSGEYAGRREILERVPFATGYGVEIGLLIDILEQFGLNAIGQVDLEQRIHRNQSLAALSRMSFTIMQTVVGRLERNRHIELVAEINRTMKAIVHTREQFHLDVRRIEEFERPPMAKVLLAHVG
jgi:nucleotide-binding universal stress UspA family protein